jgi:hypothetical protein
MHSLNVRLQFVAYLLHLFLISTLNQLQTRGIFPLKQMESNKRREAMYNIIDLQLMGGLSGHNNGGPGGSMS